VQKAEQGLSSGLTGLGYCSLSVTFTIPNLCHPENGRRLRSAVDAGGCKNGLSYRCRGSRDTFLSLASQPLLGCIDAYKYCDGAREIGHGDDLLRTRLDFEAFGLLTWGSGVQARHILSRYETESGHNLRRTAPAARDIDLC